MYCERCGRAALWMWLNPKHVCVARPADFALAGPA